MCSKRILFINFGGLGDEILFLSTIQAVKRLYSDAVITLALEPRSKGILSLTDVIDETIFADIKGKNKYLELLKLLFKIWSKNFDMVISSGANKFISVYLFLTFIKERYGYYTGKLSELMLTKAVLLNKNQYAGNMYFDLIKNICEENFELPNINISRREVIPNSVLIHPGVSKLSVQKGMIKTVTPKIWAEVIEKLADSGKKVFLTGGPDDSECIEEICRNISADKFENLYGATKNLKELAELISSAEKFLCSDSAPLHIAVALGVKTYVIFGSTDDRKLIPQNGKVIPIKADCDCPIRPCLWEKRQTTCEELSCLKIPSDKIVDEVLNS